MVRAVSRRGAPLALAVVLTFVLAAPFVAEAQPAKAVRVGFLSGNPPSDTKDALAAFRAKLRSLGYLEGYHLRQFVEAGGLMSYGADYVEAFEQGAVLVDKILKGAKPVDLPVEQPWRFALAINLKAAKGLGLTVPPSLLLRANEVIQ